MCRKNGFADDISTYAIVSGLWASAFALGAFIGPSIGGVMLDFVGFRWGSLVIIVIHVLSVNENIYFEIFDFTTSVFSVYCSFDFHESRISEAKVH
jgi:MFS family permease